MVSGPARSSRRCAVPVEDLVDVEHPAAGRGELDRQRQPAEPADEPDQGADLARLERVAADPAQPVEEERDRREPRHRGQVEVVGRRHLQRDHRPDPLAGQRRSGAGRWPGCAATGATPASRCSASATAPGARSTASTSSRLGAPASRPASSSARATPSTVAAAVSTSLSVEPVGDQDARDAAGVAFLDPLDDRQRDAGLADSGEPDQA